ETAEIVKQLVHMLILKRHVLDPIVNESVGDGLEYPERIESVARFEERNSRVDQIAQFVDVARRPITLEVAGPAITASANAARLFANGAGMDDRLAALAA